MMKTKSFRLLTVLLTAVMLVALSLNVMAAKSSAVTQDGLTAQLVTDKDSYKAGESVKASVQVDNHTGREVFIFAQINVPEGIKLASESAAFDTRLQDGETWTTPGGVTLSAGILAAVSGASTGDNMQAGFWVILTALAVCSIIAMFVYGKNKNTWLSIMLCMVMVAGMAVAAVPARAADINSDIQLSCTIQVDGKAAELSAMVSYVIYNEAEEAEEESVTTPTDAPTEAPAATEEPAATESPATPTQNPVETETPATEAPSEAPAPTPTVEPTEEPMPTPTVAPTEEPMPTPTVAPTETPVTPIPTENPNKYKDYADILDGFGDFEDDTARAVWQKNGSNELDLEWLSDGSAPSGSTYMKLGVGEETTYSRVKVGTEVNYKDIEKDTEYKLVAWVKWEGDAMPKVVFQHSSATYVGEESTEGWSSKNRRYYFTGLGAEGEWALAEITIPASDLKEFRLQIDTASWDSEKTPTDSSFSKTGDKGAVYIDNIRLLAPYENPDKYKDYADILDGFGDFEDDTARAVWQKNGSNELDLEWLSDGSAPSGSTYMKLGVGEETTYSRVKVGTAVNYNDIEKDTEYKLVAWVKWEGDAMPKIVFQHGGATYVGEEQVTGNRRYYFVGLGEEGDWALAEIAIPASDLTNFRLMIDTASWDSEKTPTDSSFSKAGDKGAVYIDNIRLLEPVVVNETADLAAAWKAKLAAEDAVSQMVVEDTSDDNPYIPKEPLPGATNLITNGDFSVGQGILRQNGVNNDVTIAASGWKPLITPATGENDMEITTDGTLKLMYTEGTVTSDRTCTGGTAIVENVAGGAEYQISFKYKIGPKPSDKTSERYGPTVSIYTYPDPSIPGADGKLLEEIAVAPHAAGTLVADGEWHEFTGRAYVSEQAWLMEVHMRCYLYEGGAVEFDDVELYMVDVPSEMELEVDSKFYYKGEETATFDATLAGNLFPDLQQGSSVDFVVYDGETSVWFTDKIALDSNYKASVQFPLSTITKLDSPYVVKASLYNSAGELVCQVSDDIFMYERPTYLDAEGNYTKIQDFNYSVGYHVYNNMYDDHMAKVKEIGVTVKPLTNAKSAAHVLEQLDACWEEGIYGVVDLYRDMKPAGHPDNVEVTIDVVTSEAVKNHPAMFGYNIMDEPWLYGTQSDIEEWLEDSYRLIRQYDKDNVILTVECTPNRYGDTEKYVDALEIDPYLPAAGAGVYERVAKAQEAVAYSKPVWTILEAYKTNQGRILSPDEARNNNYQALIAGADGIGYFSISDAGGSYTDGAGVKQYIPMWEMTSDLDSDTGAVLWAGLKEWAEKEQDLAFDHFVHGKTPDFNEKVAIEDGYIYSSWKVDNDVYMVVLNVAGAEVANLNILLTSADGSESIAEYTATIVAGRNEDTAAIKGNGSMTVTLQADEAILYKITPETASGDNTGSGDNNEGGDDTPTEDPNKGWIDILQGTGDFEDTAANSANWIEAKSGEMTNVQFKKDDSGNTYLYLGDLPEEGDTQGKSRVRSALANKLDFASNATYKVTGRVKREGVEQASIMTLGLNEQNQYTWLTFTSELNCEELNVWKDFEITFTTGAEKKDIEIRLNNMNSDATGTGAVCFDDVKVWKKVTTGNTSSGDTSVDQNDLLAGSGNFEGASLSPWTEKSGAAKNIQLKKDGTAKIGDAYLYLSDVAEGGKVSEQGASRVEYTLSGLTAGNQYQITGWVRQDGVEQPQIVVTGAKDSTDTLQGFTDNVTNKIYNTNYSLYTYKITCGNIGEWEQFSIVFTVAENKSSCTVSLNNMHGVNVQSVVGIGAVCFDDVKVLPVSTASNE